MHPALSIVFFTTASGAGFALFVLVGIGVPLGLVPPDIGFGIAVLAAGTLFAGGGLVSSVFHLGHPERAWRAFSQWRTSWLSREGVMSVLTFVPGLVFAVGWLGFAATGGFIGLCGVLAAACAIATIYCTGMIYASLKPIRQWCNGWVVPNYYVLALMSGLLLLGLIERFWVARPFGTAVLTLVAIAAAAAVKEAYWRFIDGNAARSTVASATGLVRRGPVRMLEPPHTEENYLLHEMGFRIARKHAARLRLIVRAAAFAAPALLTLVGLLWTGVVGDVAAALAVLSGGLGLIVERWLFFAEAKHTVTLYYGAETV
jgi:sulfite dehydrogenase (quinone) subunit SoeC